MIVTTSAGVMHVSDPATCAHFEHLADTMRRMADLYAAHGKAFADGVLTAEERHQLSLEAAVLSVSADQLSRALEN